MFCPYCGNPKVDKSDIFCEKCGKPVAKKETPLTQAEFRQSAVTQKNTQRIVVIAAAIVALAAIGFIIWFAVSQLLGSNDAGPTESQPASQEESNEEPQDSSSWDDGDNIGTGTALDNESYIESDIDSIPDIAIPPMDLISHVAASSSLAPMNDPNSTQMNYYTPDNTIDGRDDTAWVEGASGDGTGEWMQIGFVQPVRLYGAYIKNGYWKSDRRLIQNHRLSHIRVEFSDGASEEFYLTDPAEADFNALIQGQGERIDFSVPHDTTYIRIVILGTYSGTDGEDTCVSEIVVF